MKFKNGNNFKEYFENNKINELQKYIDNKMIYYCNYKCYNNALIIILNGKGGDLFPVGNHKILANKITSFFKDQKSLKKSTQISTVQQILKSAISDRILPPCDHKKPRKHFASSIY